MVQSSSIVPIISVLILRICFLDVESMTGGMESIESDSGGCCAPTLFAIIDRAISYCALQVDCFAASRLILLDAC